MNVERDGTGKRARVLSESESRASTHAVVTVNWRTSLFLPPSRTHRRGLKDIRRMRVVLASSKIALRENRPKIADSLFLLLFFL